MKKVYSVDLINSFFSKQEATELILGLVNYKIELHSNKLFSTQVKYGVEDEESKYRLDRLTLSRDQIQAFLNETEDVCEDENMYKIINMMNEFTQQDFEELENNYQKLNIFLSNLFFLNLWQQKLQYKVLKARSIIKWLKSIL